MPNKSKIKGNLNETWIASYFQSWWGSPFRRMPTSGALRWKGHSWTYGDILGPEDFQAIIEAKHYKYISIGAVLTHSEAYVTFWWQQVCNDVRRAAKETKLNVHPLLVFKQDRSKHHIAMAHRLFKELYVLRLTEVPYIMLCLPGQLPVSVLLLKTFLDTTTPATFKQVTSSLDSLSTI
jgi:hypothetical protein